VTLTSTLISPRKAALAASLNAVFTTARRLLPAEKGLDPESVKERQQRSINTNYGYTMHTPLLQWSVSGYPPRAARARVPSSRSTVEGVKPNFRRKLLLFFVMFTASDECAPQRCKPRVAQTEPNAIRYR